MDVQKMLGGGLLSAYDKLKEIDSEGCNHYDMAAVLQFFRSRNGNIVE